jgi:hypothetical protein
MGMKRVFLPDQKQGPSPLEKALCTILLFSPDHTIMQQDLMNSLAKRYPNLYIEKNMDKICEILTCWTKLNYIVLWGSSRQESMFEVRDKGYLEKILCGALVIKKD